MLTAVFMLAILVSCSLGTGEKPGDDASTMGHPESVLLSDSSNVSISDSLGRISDLFPPVSYTLGDSADWLHRSMKLRVLSDDWCSRLGTDTCFYYPERVKIPVGQFQGKNLFLELGDFRDYRYYAGASVYWGDSLIYLTDRYLANDWHICMVHPLPERNTVYVLLLIASEAEGTPCLWNVVRMDDIFSMFGDIFGGRGGGFGGGFGGFSGFGGGGSQQRRYRGSDLRVKVKLTLKEISTGVEKKFKLKKYVPCDQCHGTGAEGDGGSETCPTCKGSGSVIRNQQTILGTMQTRVTCSTCGGEGKIIKNKCKKCGGDGIIYGEEVVSVKIPAGVAEGMQLSMGGKGNAGKHNGVAGDLLILVEEEPHQDLIRDENDLIYNLLLSFPTAALGGAVEIPTIDGKVKVKIDSGTQPGKVLRLRGKGLPNVNGYGTGDLLVNISIYVPEALNKEEKSTLEKMEASDNFKPNTSVKEKIFKKFKSFFD